jgi:hypothetical protein
MSVVYTIIPYTYPPILPILYSIKTLFFMELHSWSYRYRSYEWSYG